MDTADRPGFSDLRQKKGVSAKPACFLYTTEFYHALRNAEKVDVCTYMMRNYSGGECNQEVCTVSIKIYKIPLKYPGRGSSGGEHIRKKKIEKSFPKKESNSSQI
jgi:hypothetical protein